MMVLLGFFIPVIAIFALTEFAPVAHWIDGRKPWQLIFGGSGVILLSVLLTFGFKQAAPLVIFVSLAVASAIAHRYRVSFAKLEKGRKF
ncbi:hypothetical protein [Schleiferilactobacillus perolens]|jgi:hypothetical protein|uniref:Uncharacterized protein n=1 Tax=Schleiferilactobacillus perolens DSM 12744 TaxID=1423792 RepID=A0A0R1MTJ4_9LACO|nr:hypothetical protein [Schleiferilactobacillus perolens]KRL11313.1 hypothetical protein FD09_GL000681 [Schleiferilactobacillus perolens DSM 12744]MCI1891459.1 hypothetical protein [Schleiferilactobacillus harbinensis]MCI1913860.1 hypothetical protein [Schleiferilactobacillus harbinensis]MCI2170455.1 hypothetical protein [Schleiferilactobacillus perolens]